MAATCPTHVEGRSTPKVVRLNLARRESKVGEEKRLSSRCDEDVLWLEVSVVDAQTMAVVDGVNQLEEDRGDEPVVAEVAVLLGDHRKQVARRDVVEHDIDDRGCLDDPAESDHVRV